MVIKRDRHIASDRHLQAPGKYLRVERYGSKHFFVFICDVSDIEMTLNVCIYKLFSFVFEFLF